MKTLFVFLIVIAVIASSSSSIGLSNDVQTPITILKQYNISINDVELWALGFDCQSEDQYIGSHLINPGKDIVIEFHGDNNDATNVSCLFYWNKKDKNINVYDKSLKKLCGGDLVNTCNWLIMSDGFYLYDNSQNPSKYVKMYDW